MRPAPKGRHMWATPKLAYLASPSPTRAGLPRQFRRALARLLRGRSQELQVVHDALEVIGPFLWSAVGLKVRQMVGRAGFTRHDRDDLKQELLLHVLERWKHFDPAKSHPYAFATM